MKWYKGFDVVKALDNYKVSNLSSFAPLRLPVQDIYKLGDKRIIVGRIESGKIKNNDLILAIPSSGLHANGYSLVRKIIYEKG